MKRLAITGLAVLSLGIAVAGCGSSNSTTPPPQKPGWTAIQIEETLAAVKKESKTPPLTEAQAKCVTAFIAGTYTEGELVVLSSAAAASFRQKVEPACGVK